MVSLGLNLVLITFLIILTAFFVAAEFAFVRVRSSKIDHLASEGNKKAINVQKILANLDGFLSACQLGITVTALGLGWLAEPTVEELIHPLLASIHLPESAESLISFAIAFSTVTFLHVVIGELAPKTVAIQKAEWVSLNLAGPMRIFYIIMYPFIFVLNGSARLLVGIFGLKPSNEHEEVHSEEELRIILSESYESGEINQSEYKYVNRIFNFDELVAKEIMVPRVDMMTVDINQSSDEIIDIIRKEQFTRLPVVNNDKDEVVGMIHTKDFFLGFIENKDVAIQSLIRPVMNVPENMEVTELLKKMQSSRVPFAILRDEYGGTSGLVTIEDILEEIVGEIRDEFDIEEKANVESLSDSEIIVDGKVLISEINELLHMELQIEDYDTIGGWLYVQNPDIEVNDTYEYENLLFVIKEREENRINRIQITKKK